MKAMTKRRTLVILGIAAILVVALVVASAIWLRHGGQANAAQSGQSGATGQAGSAIATESVVREDLHGSVNVAGTLHYADSHQLRAGYDGIVTQLPEPGTQISAGAQLYQVGDDPAYLMRGATPAWRDFEDGMSNGQDVQQLEQSLKDLGYFADEPDERFDAQTISAIRNWQDAVGLTRSGRLQLGRIIFAPADLRVGTLSTRVGDRVTLDTSLFSVSSMQQVVDANVSLAQQDLAEKGREVTIQLPDGSTTPGTISSVGTPVERGAGNGQDSQADGQGSQANQAGPAAGNKERILPITVTPSDPEATSTLQEASVTVALPSQTRENVLTVPVNALLALTPTQFGVEIAREDGSFSQIPVETGLFAAGRVEVSGDDLAEGQHVVVPSR